MGLAFLPLGILLVGIDTLIALLTFQWIGVLKKLFSFRVLRSVPVGDDPSHRVMTGFKGNLLETPVEGAFTLFDLSKMAFEKHSDQNCVGTREFLGWHKPKVKKFGTDISWMTYKEVGDQAYKFGAALRASGVVSAPETTSLKKFTTSCSVAIFEDTCPEWMIAAQGAFTQSMIVTTIYATLGMDAVIDSINDGLISAIVCNKKNVGNLMSKIAMMPTLKTIVYTNYGIAPDDKMDLPKPVAGITVVSFDDFVKSGDPAKFPPTPPQANTTAVIMYTSGSTGKPKGVVITHSQVVASMAAGSYVFRAVPEDVYMCYLPMAHIMELMAEFLFMSAGCKLVYADPKTLTSKGSYPVGALEAFSPSLMVGVPKVWDSVKKGVEAKIAAESPLKQFLINTAFKTRFFANKLGYDTPLFKALVFKKFKIALGGNMRLAVSGGGPLNAEVQHFTRTMFSMPLIQGYGLTETNAGLTVQDFDDLRTGIAGVPTPSMEVKLMSTPDVVDKQGKPYLSTDRVDHEGNPVLGRGEILCRGGNVSEGYYLMEDKTKEVFEKDTGFFHTGDIGQFMDDGSIRIVDRKKNLVKLKGGEYVALENMEMIYGNSVFVDAAEGGICCYGDGDMDRPIALMQLNEAYTMKWAIDNKVEGNFEDLKKSKALYDAVLASMKMEAEKGKLTHLENLAAVVFMPESWTPENGCLTAANKLQRKTVITMFEKEFEETKKKGIF